MASFTEISVSQLNRLLGTPDCPVLIDLRIDQDFDQDPRLIPGAYRQAFTDLAPLVERHQGDKLVVYCQKGLKISQGAAAILRDAGLAAEVLEGGHVAWRDANFPMIDSAKMPPRNEQGRTVWVTRHRPKIDRIACPWLIRRFIDPGAQFLFVSPGQVMNVAEKFKATPFDMEPIDGEDLFWSHRGTDCTFDTLIREFGLRSAALDRLAVIVRGADTDRHDLAPEAAGLMAASLGLSRMHRDDLQQLDASMMLYDAFYRWARDAQGEKHDWPPAGKTGQGNKN
ncbi:MAG: sulfurtransferase/chromate resistance protein [Pseudomonadota bacterium]